MDSREASASRAQKKAERRRFAKHSIGKAPSFVATRRRIVYRVEIQDGGKIQAGAGLCLTEWERGFATKVVRRDTPLVGFAQRKVTVGNLATDYTDNADSKT